MDNKKVVKLVELLVEYLVVDWGLKLVDLMVVNWVEPKVEK